MKYFSLYLDKKWGYTKQSAYVFLLVFLLALFPFLGEGPKAHLRRLAECIRWSYGAGIVLRLGNIARLELNYCIPMGVQSGDRCGVMLFFSDCFFVV